LEREPVPFENSSDVITLVGVNETQDYVSPSAERFFGFLSEEARAMAVFDFVHPKDRDRVLRMYADLVQRPGGMARAKLRVRDATGTWRWVETVARNMLHDIDMIRRNERDDAQRARLEQVGATLRATIAQMRRLMFDLRPSPSTARMCS
jgi:PAS domain S-box-containing protein